ncbi:MAG: diguanylate cyclase [Oscillospiraceae bacterium]|nr:diguanylate cyclase [Oscillospiraceae bacterium]
MQTDSLKRITLSLTLGMMLLFVITFINATGHINSGIEITDFDLIRITRTDGTVDEYEDNHFDKSTKGDFIHAEFKLPEKPGDVNYSLFSHEYNCVVTVKYKDRILFTYGQEASNKGRELGHFLIRADIPDEAWGNTVTAEFLNVDYSQPYALNPFVILPTADKTKYIFNGSAVPYFVSIMFGVLCFIALIPLLFWNNKTQRKAELITLMAFCLHTTVWSLGYQKMGFVTYDNNIFIGDLEYIGIFGLAACFSVFMALIAEKGLYKKLMSVLAGVSSVYYVVSTLLNYTTESWHYCRMLTPVHFFIGIGVIIMFVHFVRSKNNASYQDKSIRTGSIVFLMFISADFIIYFAKARGFVAVDVVFVPFGLFSFLLIISISYLMYLVEFIMEAHDKERLHEMAYTDGMTGVKNRRACLDMISELGKTEDDYGIVFFDVNNLKTANDKYSHDTGDRLIRLSANAISEAFGEDCFCGRYGGDEFIACIKCSDTVREIEKRLEKFRQKLSEINNSNELPFQISIAYGYAVSSENTILSSEEVIKLADQKMYEKKKEMKLNA